MTADLENGVHRFALLLSAFYSISYLLYARPYVIENFTEKNNNNRPEKSQNKNSSATRKMLKGFDCLFSLFFGCPFLFDTFI